MLPSRVVRPLATALCLAAGIATPIAAARAAADDSGAVLWVPWAKASRSVATEVVVVNRGDDPIQIRMHALAARSAGGGRFACTPPPRAMPLDPGEQVTFDVSRDCATPPAAFDGALRIEGMSSGLRVPRIRAVARWVVADQSGTRDQEVAVPVLAIGSLPGIETVQRIDDLAHDDVGALPVQTDCQISAAPADDRSPRRLELELRRSGSVLGRPINVSVSPGTVENLADLFSMAGAGSGAFDGVQLVVAARRQPEAGIAVACSVLRARTSPSARPSPAVTVHAGLPLDGASLVRRHRVEVSTSADGNPLIVRGTESALHLMFLRHEDRITCSVRPTDPMTVADALRIAVVTPDRSRTLGGAGPDVVLEETGTRGGTAEGLGGAWALIVEQARPDPSLGIAYRLSCTTGNGASPPLLAAVNGSPLPRP
jgi:hypothetical protein